MTADPKLLTLDEMRDRLEHARRAAEAEGQASKEAMFPLECLRDAYSRFTPSERVLGGRVLSEWLGSDDENRRFDALALIDEFRVAAAVPAMSRLADRLRMSRAPGAPFEREKIGRILRSLEGLDALETPTTPITTLRRRVAIRSPADLGEVLAMIRAFTSDGHLAEARGQGAVGTDSSVAGLPADGPWPDVIDAEFRDRSGRRYRLFVETYHGAGGEWAPFDDDD